MGHNISALIIKGSYDKEVAIEYDLRGIDIGYGLTLFLIDVYYTAYWQHALELEKKLVLSPDTDMLVPDEEVVAFLVKEITSPEQEYALILTDYAGGFGYQYATILRGRHSIETNVETINDALKYLGVEAQDGKDEFETVGLSEYRDTPDHIRKYEDLCDELGL